MNAPTAKERKLVDSVRRVVTAAEALAGELATVKGNRALREVAREYPPEWLTGVEAAARAVEGLAAEVRRRARKRKR